MRLTRLFVALSLDSGDSLVALKDVCTLAGLWRLGSEDPECTRTCQGQGPAVDQRGWE